MTTEIFVFSGSTEAGSGSSAPTDGYYSNTSHPAPLVADTTPVEHDRADVAADAATTRRIGQRVDRHYPISVLAQRRQQSAHVESGRRLHQIGGLLRPVWPLRPNALAKRLLAV